MFSDDMPKDIEEAVRIPSGIPGLDKLIQGGFLKGSAILIAGGTGTGKTIFCAQYIWEGLQRGENCLFITLEERPVDIEADVKNFGWDFEKYIEKKQLFLEFRDPFEMTDIVTPLIEKIKSQKIFRVAIDSSSVLGLYFKDPFEVRKQLYKLIMALKSTEATTLLTAEIPEETHQISRFGVEEYIVDGVIILHYMGLGEGTFNSIQIRKMRRTRHEKDIYPMEFGDKGILIKK